MKAFVGIDWGREDLWVAVVDQEENTLGAKRFDNTMRGAKEMVEWILKVSSCEKEEIAIGIETKSLSVVDVLLEEDFEVFTISPFCMEKFRGMYSPSRSKSDKQDAVILARTIRRDPKAFRKVVKEDEKIVRLREWTRRLCEIKEEQVRLMNRIQDFLARYFPNFLRIAPSFDSKWVWELWEICKSPREAKKLKRETVEKILKWHKVRSVTVEQVISELSEEGLIQSKDLEKDYKVLVEMDFERLMQAFEQAKVCERHIDRITQEIERWERKEENRKVTTVESISSLPGAGRVVTAIILAEAYSLVRNAKYRELRIYSGAAPVTRQSGSSRFVMMRRSCNRYLRYALYHLARGAMVNSVHWRRLYAEERRRGKRHGTALRKIGDKLLCILARLLIDQSLYDEEVVKKNAEKKLALTERRP